MTETHAQAIKRICLKWRHKKINGYCPIISLIERLQREERKRRTKEKKYSLLNLKMKANNQEWDCKYCGRNTICDCGFHDCNKSPSGFCIPKMFK